MSFDEERVRIYGAKTYKIPGELDKQLINFAFSSKKNYTAQLLLYSFTFSFFKSILYFVSAALGAWSLVKYLDLRIKIDVAI
ncbi:hypothetical protein [Microbulbifer sp. JMSA008]|uniref:hypothetical protein n=1 Tax=Microbulbifer sp. JMSA008 TaxID=3243373 RepID=UPI00403A76D1